MDGENLKIFLSPRLFDNSKDDLIETAVKSSPVNTVGLASLGFKFTTVDSNHCTGTI